ncbi:MAG TPA: D-alanyl-D-alanine carboxypeptidase/D-alanyl-D-alanine-endopeptidase [Pseudonocardiaceae bacterium]
MGTRIGRAFDAPRTTGGKLLAAGAVLVVAVAIGVGTAFGAPGVLASLSLAANPVSTTPPPAPVLPSPALRALGDAAPLPSERGMSIALDPLATTDAVGDLTGAVVDAVTGTSLWERGGTRSQVPGSTAKIVTAAAALLAIDPDRRLETTVVSGAAPGTVVLVGGGDPTLSALPAGQESVYPGAPKLDDLVAQVKAAAPGGVTAVQVDVSRYPGDPMGPGWLAADIPGGYIAPIVPVMLDGGRGVPTEQDTPRSATPALTAAAELARRLGADPASVSVGTAPQGASVLGTVRSQPVRELVIHALQLSDNVLAEVLAHEVAIAAGGSPTFDGAIAAIRQVLTSAGIDLAGLDLVDGSGLSAQNKLTARGLAAVLAAVVGPAGDPDSAALRPLLDGLPIAGGTGTLTSRYSEGDARAGRGYVRAKTGTLTDVNSLAGVVLDQDGRLLVFALLSNGAPSVTARPALDAIAATLRTCGCR